MHVVLPKPHMYLFHLWKNTIMTDHSLLLWSTDTTMFFLLSRYKQEWYWYKKGNMMSAWQHKLYPKTKIWNICACIVCAHRTNTDLIITTMELDSLWQSTELTQNSTVPKQFCAEGSVYGHTLTSLWVKGVEARQLLLRVPQLDGSIGRTGQQPILNSTVS